jgi:hypothetical protein
MTAKSAYAQSEKRPTEAGYCLPLSIDSILKVSDLPDEYYDLCFEAHHDPSSSYNKTVGYILKNFFGVEPLLDAGLPAVGKFTAFGGSPQSYMPDAPYDYSGKDEEIQKLGVTPGQLRLLQLLRIAKENSCNVLFAANSALGEHVSSLDLIDVGHPDGSPLYFVRDKGRIENNVIYTPADLSGLYHTYGLEGISTAYSPLPQVQRPYFPTGQSSWELAIFPPDPRI